MTVVASGGRQWEHLALVFMSKFRKKPVKRDGDTVGHQTGSDLVGLDQSCWTGRNRRPIKSRSASGMKASLRGRRSFTASSSLSLVDPPPDETRSLRRSSESVSDQIRPFTRALTFNLRADTWLSSSSDFIRALHVFFLLAPVGLSTHDELSFTFLSVSVCDGRRVVL